MNFKMIHNNFNVLDLEKSLAFYKEAFGMHEVRRMEPEDKSFILVYLGSQEGEHLLELTWLRDRKTPYQLGENEFHLAFETTEFDAAYEKHREMGCICFENKAMGIYFVSDPDGYWLEILPAK